MPKTTTVALGGKEYVLEELVKGRARIWREEVRGSRMMAVFDNLDEIVQDVLTISGEIVQQRQAGQSDIRDVPYSKMLGIVAHAPAILRTLLGSVDEIWALLLAYSPELRDDAKWLDENAYDEEAVSAFVEALKLAFPFTALLALVRGSKPPSTSTNSPSTNGATGTKKRAATKAHG